MAESTFSYVIENDRAFFKALEDAQKKVGNLAIPLNQIALDWYKSNRAIFKLKSRGLYPDFSGPKVGETWSKDQKKARPKKRTRNPNMTAYQNYKVKKYGFDYPLLKAKGELEKSITDRGDGNTVFINTGTGLVLGTSVEYGIYHQSDKKRDRIPLRKFIFIGPEAPRFATSQQVGRPQRWLKIIDNYVTKKLASN